MNCYKYKAQSADGSKVSGVIEAHDEFEAASRIKLEYPIILKLTQIQSNNKRHIDLNEPMWVSDKVLSMTASQFAILLRAGMSAARTVEVIAEQTADRLMKRILKSAAQDVMAGQTLASSLEKHGKKIPAAFIETVRAGEESGTLEKSFERLGIYYEKAHKMKSKVRGAMMYPAFLAVLAVIVVAIVITVTVPVMSGIITSSGGEIPVPTRILLAISDFLSNRWWVLIIVVAAIAALLISMRFNDKGKRILALVALKMPVIGRINVMKSAAQFANTVSTLLSAGLPITQCLAITGRVIDNFAVGKIVSGYVAGIETGKSLGSVMKDDPYLPPLLVEMTAVGEESGALEQTLENIGEYFDSETEQASAKALSMLEPAITIGMGIIIGFVVISLYLPMFTMYSNI